MATTVTENPVSDANDVAYTGFEGNFFTDRIIAYFSTSGGVRFPSVAVPQGASVSTALLNLYVSDIIGSGSVTFALDDKTNADSWSSSTISGQVVDLATTKTNVATSGVWKSLGFTAGVNSIVNRTGWASNNAVRFLINQASFFVDFYDQSTGSPPALEVTYTAGPTETQLEAADSVNTHAAPTAFTQQQHSLGVADSAQVQVVEQVGVELDVAELNAVSAVHEHVGAPTAFTQTHDVAVGDAAHGQTVAGTALGQVHDVVIQGVAHDHALVRASIFESISLRPASDVSQGGWTATLSGSLYATLDETSPNDGDYIASPTDPAGAACEVALNTGTDPDKSDFHAVQFRAEKPDGAPQTDLTVKLMQGGSEIASWTVTLDETPQTYSRELSVAEADSITDYGDLRLRFVAESP